MRSCWTRLALTSLMAAVSMSLFGAVRDTAFYPVTSHAPDDKPAPALRFDTGLEATIPGLPAGPHRATEDGATFKVPTTSGLFLVDGAGVVRPTPAGSIPGPEVSDVTAGAGCSWQEGQTPRWLERLHSPALSGHCVAGPEGIVAILAGDGTVYGRDRRNGHLLWRRVAPHRISRQGASLGAYLLIVADGSRTLEALRWTDGSVAGVFQLGSEDASFASVPIVSGKRIAVLSVQSPRKETRLLVLRVRPQAPVPPSP